MKKVLLVLGVMMFLGMLLVGGTVFMFMKSSRKPLTSASSTRPAMPLPADAIVLTVADGAEVVAPFTIHDEDGAVGGVAAFQPKGSKTDAHVGKVKLTAKVAVAGSYTAWLHAKWRDSCSNSCSLKIGEGTDFLVGNDDVFNVFHWVPASKHTFAVGDNPVVISEREDGIYFDQVLFTKDTAYVPTGAITTAGVLRDIRRFADTFTRSPGHGNEGWEFDGKGKFDVAFSFDPNRIPNQYALSGDASAGSCYAYVKGAPWYGCKMSFTFMPTSDGEYGCVMERRDITLVPVQFIMNGESAQLKVGANDPIDLKHALRKNQWHRVVVERWAWVTRVFLDGNEVAADTSVHPMAGKAGVCVMKGTAVFDDFEIEEIPWMADNGSNLKIDWTQSEGADWFRTTDNAIELLSGKTGTIKAGLGGIPLNEIVLTPPPSTAQTTVPDISAPGLQRLENSNLVTYRLPANAEGSCTHATFTPGKDGSGLTNVALRFGRHTPSTFNVGPYTFATREMDDPSDYLDFTDDEYRAMQKSPEAAKLQRQAKVKPVIGHGGEDDEGPWAYMGGYWTIDVNEGVLKGRASGNGAILRHAQEISSDVEARFKVRLATAASSAEIELYAGADPGLRVLLAPQTTPPAPLTPGVALALNVPADAKWHEITLRIDVSKLTAKIDRAPLQEATFKRGVGDRIYLRVPKGAADFDDVEFIAQRATEKSVLYAFNQPEPDWWREPADKWIDHGGIACVLASSWISLVSPTGQATMWNKRTFSSDALVAFNVEENTDWRGWDKHPSHIHFPFENIETTLANEKDPSVYYTLTVNAERHSATILYRNGKEVARVRQDRSFPLRYIGSHMPFLPRTNRICLIKTGGKLRGILNGKEILTFTDPEPLTVSKVGLGGHDTHINFSHIEIVNLATDSLPSK
ncbi:MAG: hypothetical protein WCT04_14530 [Planctomycetota bacterium]